MFLFVMAKMRSINELFISDSHHKNLHYCDPIRNFNVVGSIAASAMLKDYLRGNPCFAVGGLLAAS